MEENLKFHSKYLKNMRCSNETHAYPRNPKLILKATVIKRLFEKETTEGQVFS